MGQAKAQALRDSRGRCFIQQGSLRGEAGELQGEESHVNRGVCCGPWIPVVGRAVLEGWSSTLRS